MSTLAERIAAKKAAAAGESPKQEAPKVEAPKQETSVTPIKAAAPVIQKTAEELAKELVPMVDSTGKPLSGFALIKARKELAAKLLQQEADKEKNAGNAGKGNGDSGGNSNGEVAQQPIAQGTPTSLSASEESGSDAEEIGEAEEENGTPDEITADIIHEIEEAESDAYKNATPEARQAYADIKPRIDSLVSLMGEDIKNAMQELKKSLMQNPNAVALMLPSDIGQMVIALRKMTGVELAKATESKSKGNGKKPKEIALTAEELDKAWEEL